MSKKQTPPLKEILEALQNKPPTVTEQGSPTSIACPRCRNQELHRFDPGKTRMGYLKTIAGDPKPSKRKRQRKKNLKKYRSTQAWKNYILAAMIKPILPTYLKCPACGYRPNAYSWIKDCVTIEPLNIDRIVAEATPIKGSTLVRPR
jgi:hypothetical protein